MLLQVSSVSSLSPLVGRDADIRRVLDTLGVGGEPKSIHHVIGGDAGVGKTRYVSALAEGAERAGWRILTGHSLDFGEGALPYLPFSEALGQCATEHGDLLEPILRRFPVVSGLLPGRRMLGGSTASAETPVESLDRALLFDGVHGGLDELASTSPVLFVVEDVHWADRSSRDLLSFLLTRSFRNSVAVVVTYRSDDLHRRHPLRPTLAEWGRLATVRRIQLEPLDPPAMQTLVRHLAARSEPPEWVSQVVDRAEGNPFFAEELTCCDLESRLPITLAELLLVRLDRLSPAEVRVVRTAACAGRRVSHRLLAEVLGGDPEEIERALRAAVEANVLVSTGGEDYAFRHALLAEAVYDDLLPGERVRIHDGYARALDSGRATGTAAELTRHARLANDLPTALRASIVAGDEAASVGAPDEAARYYETALELLPTLPDADGRPDVVTLLTCANEALILSGQAQRAVALVGESLEQSGAELTDTDRARLHIALAHAVQVADEPSDPVEHTTAALDLLGDEETPVLASALAAHAGGLASRGRFEEAVGTANAALALAKKLDLPRVQADAGTTLAMLAEYLGDPDVATTTLSELERQAAEAGDLTGQMRALVMIGQTAADKGDLDAADEAFGRAQGVAERTERPWAPFGFDARYFRSSYAYSRGSFDRALGLSDLSGESPPPVVEALLRTVRAQVFCARGDLEAVEVLLDEVRPWWASDALIPIGVAVPGMVVRAARGDLEGVWAFHERAVSSVIELWHENFGARIRLGAEMLALLNDALSGPAREKWVPRVKELLSGTDQVRAFYARAGRPPGPEWNAWVARLDAEVGTFTGHDQQSVRADWATAIEQFEQAGFGYEAARSRVRSGIPEELPPGRRTLEKIGAIPHAEPVISEVALTPRENEILALVAEGLSNGEIGKRLFISTKTVSVHVSNILAKLQVSSRTEAAAHYHRSNADRG